MSATPEQGRYERRGWGWTLLATALITLGALLSPVAVVSVWAHHGLSDTNRFVDTLGPLADEPAIQDLIATEATMAIESRLNIDQLANDLFSGLDELDLNPRARAALGLLEAPAVAGVKGVIHNAVTDFVESDAFSRIWRETLTITHTQFVNTATGQADAAIAVGENQEISLQLGPIVQAVKERLIADGFALAERIPAVSRSVVIAESTSAERYLALYRLMVALGIWLPWVTLLLLAAGVFVARRRVVALAWAAGAVLLTIVLVASGISVGKDIFALAVASAVPHDAAIILYEELLGFVTTTVAVVGWLAAIVLVVTLLVMAVLSGPWRWARTLRGSAASVFVKPRRG